MYLAIFYLIMLIGNISLLILMRKTPRFGLASYIGLALYLIYLFAFNYLTGGFYSIAFIGYLYFPWVGFLYSNKFGLTWTIIPILALVILFLMAEYGYEFPNTIPTESTNLFNVIVISVFAIYYGVLFWFDNQNEERLFIQIEENKKVIVEQEKMASLGQLTAGVAHEINNPINFITSSVQALKMDLQELLAQSPSQIELQNTTQKEILEEMELMIASIDEGATRTATIIQSLRIFATENKEAFAPGDIHRGIDSTLELLKHKIPNGVVVSKKYEDIPLINCQINRLNQVFMNVLDNAIFAVGEIGNIEVTTQRQKENIKVSIKDTGSGMTEETRSKIFDPFFTTKKVGQGTGLGLSISYGIIKDHKGKIQIISKLGEGAEVVISLPIGDL